MNSLTLFCMVYRMARRENHTLNITGVKNRESVPISLIYMWSNQLLYSYLQWPQHANQTLSVHAPTSPRKPLTNSK